MKPYDAEGLNCGSLPNIAAGQTITPAAEFFKRNHAAIPTIEPTTWRLAVGGLVGHPMVLSLNDLNSNYERHDITATIVCAGLRRQEFLALGSLHGELPWGDDAASTGQWSGFLLADLLRNAAPTAGAHFVEFVGLDRVERRGHQFGFGGSIDFSKAINGNVLLATHLNGQTLSPDHGYPMRVIVPGWIGARCVKWLGAINVVAEPSSNYFQTRAYRVQPQLNPADPHDVSAGVAMNEVPRNAVIISPTAHQIVPAGLVTLRGWAIGQGCQPLASVEVSTDDGSTWTKARITQSGEPWTWSFWEASVSLTSGAHTICARATDPLGTMHSDVAAGWNVKGYGNNAWYRLPVTAH